MAKDLVAEYLARGGRVTRGAEGVAYGVDKAADKAKRQAAQWDGTPILAATDHRGRGWYVNAEGEVIGHD